MCRERVKRAIDGLNPEDEKDSEDDEVTERNSTEMDVGRER